MPYLILDRDGVINEESPNYIRSLADWHPIAGSLEAIALLSQAGWHIAIATNQSGLGRGYFTEDTLRTIHDALKNQVTALGGHIDYIAYCPHHPDDKCECRKPKPGLLYEIAKHWQIKTSEITMVGDTLRDVEAARAAGSTPVLVRSGHGFPEEILHEDPTLKVYENLAAFAKAIWN